MSQHCNRGWDGLLVCLPPDQHGAMLGEGGASLRLERGRIQVDSHGWTGLDMDQLHCLLSNGMGRSGPLHYLALLTSLIQKFV